MNRINVLSSNLTPPQVKLQKKMDKVKSVSQQQETAVSPNPLLITLNCTVAYLRQCMAERKCEKSCQSMGASSYRWFGEDGCCECVGHNCINYGINQSRCLDCGYDEEDDIPESEMSDEEIDRLTQEYENDLEAMN